MPFTRKYVEIAATAPTASETKAAASLVSGDYKSERRVHELLAHWGHEGGAVTEEDVKFMQTNSFGGNASLMSNFVQQIGTWGLAKPEKDTDEIPDAPSTATNRNADVDTRQTTHKTTDRYTDKDTSNYSSSADSRDTDRPFGQDKTSKVTK